MARRSQVIKGGYWRRSGACPGFITMASLDQAARREQDGGVLLLSRCELVALPGRLHSALLSIHSMAVVTGGWARACWWVGGARR